MHRRALLFGCAALGAACGAKPLPPPPPAPRVSSAAELIPADLDVVIRLDLARVKAALGAVALSALAGQVLARGKPEQGADDLELSSLLEADQVYLGYRPSPLWAPLDRVLALQGRFTQLMRPPLGFGGATDLGGDVRYWDAKLAPARGGVARIYAMSQHLRAFVSEAEIDAVERALAGLSAARRLEPPEEGTLSLAARPALLGVLSGHGTLRELLEGAKALHAVADLESDGVQLKAELVLETPEQAAQLAAAAKLVLERALADSRVHAELRADAERVLLSAQLSRAQLLPALGCLGLGSTAEGRCPW
ncbi:MAG TPA: hypothetical protein VNG33_17595 [Polyangiaceae bacterium]|nr:hypothetical protein [Polyangiaceae bacterium]